MGDEGEYWNDHKDYERKQKAKYEKSIGSILTKLIRHVECKEIGDHWRIGGVWDFWHTGTVRHIKTGESISIIELADKFKNSAYDRLANDIQKDLTGSSPDDIAWKD